MQYIYEQSKENPKLAKAELLAILNPKKYTMEKNLLFSSKLIDCNRLAYTKGAYKFLGTDINKIKWNNFYKTSFRVRAKGLDEKDIAGKIWERLKQPKVDLENPKTKIAILEKRYYTLE